MAAVRQQQPQKMDVRDFVKAINIRASKAHRSVFRAVIAGAAVTEAQEVTLIFLESHSKPGCMFCIPDQLCYLPFPFLTLPVTAGKHTLML